MNKRKTKKKHKYIIENIQKFKLDEDEALLIKYNHNEWSRDTISRFYEHIQDKLNCKVMFVPKDFKLSKVKPRCKRADLIFYDDINTKCKNCGKELFIFSGLHSEEYVCDDKCFDEYNDKLKGE